MKPSDAELNELLRSAQWIDLAEDSHGVELSMRQTKTAMQLAKAELQRRQQPANVPVELARRWWGHSPIGSDPIAHVANCAYAYGREQGQWVPVSERLPDDDAKVIYSSPYVGVRQGRYIADGCEFSSRGGLLHYSDVTHWMPLPEPPTC